MSMVSSGDYPGKSRVHILPIINLDLNGMSFIYSTLYFFIQQSQELELQTSIITFDQSLWTKVNEIVHVKRLNIVLILRDFHAMMSFAGSVCYYHVPCEFQSDSKLYGLPECQGTPCLKQVPYMEFK